MLKKNSSNTDEIKLYYEKRLREYGITDDINNLVTPVFENVEGEWKKTGQEKSLPAFQPSQLGIRINYFDEKGNYLSYKKEGTKWPRDFSRERLAKDRSYEKEGRVLTQKYHQEAGSPTFPYLTPGVIKTWIKKQEIETLVLIEGEFKAYKAWMQKEKCKGMEPVQFIGISGIQGFYGDQYQHKMEINYMIQKIIIDCKVKHIVLMLDADALSLNYKDDKDLYLRASSFANSVKNFRTSLHLLLEDKNIPLSQVYFMHLKTKFIDNAKGLDDLLIQFPAKSQEIFEDMLNFYFAKEYFNGEIITETYENKIDKYFGINNKETFYSIYKQFIGSRPFIFKRTKFEWIGDKLHFVKSEDSDRFMRVGINWMKKVKVPNHRGLLEEKVEKWSVAEIMRDYPKSIAEQMVKHDIPRYDRFYIEPCFDANKYRRVLHNCYNLMEPIMWDIKPGKIDNTLQFLKHIFGGEGEITWNEEHECYEEKNIKGDQFTVAIDYLTIIHQFPKQKTFVPCLVSKEQGTGKTTFLDWLCVVYNGNGTILDNERFKMNFNSHYASKFIIGLDEGFLDVEKKAERERLKKMVTSKTMFLEMKGVNVDEIPYYGKLIICSNDADNLMKMEEEDTRWFVVKVPKATKKDPDLEKKLMEEVPAWLHYIANRKIFHEKVDRLWFDPADFETEQMRKIVQVTKNRIDAVLENYIKDIFLTYKVDELRINRKTLLKQINNPEISKYKIDEKELKYFLEEKKEMSYQNPGRCKVPIQIVGYSLQNVPEITYFEEIQRHYLFTPENWLNEKEYELYRNPYNFSNETKEPGGKFAEAKNLDNSAYKYEKNRDELPF